MLAFVQQILAFATFEVLEPNWRKLEERLEAGKVETVDQLLRDHVDFLDTCLKECMLTSSKLLKVGLPFNLRIWCRYLICYTFSAGVFKISDDMFHFRVVHINVHEVRFKGACRFSAESSWRSGDGEKVGRFGQV